MTVSISSHRDPQREEWLELLAGRLAEAAGREAGRALHVGVIGALGAHDVGDEAMLVGLSAELRDRLPGIQFTVFSTRPSVTEAYLGVDALPTLHRWVFDRRRPGALALYGLDRLESHLTCVLRWLLPLREEWCGGWVYRGAFAALERRVRRLAQSAVTDGRSLPDTLIGRHVAALQRLDALIMLGGGYLNSWHVKAASYLYSITVDAAVDLGKPVFGSGLNLGPFNGYDLRRLAHTLRRYELIGLRDQQESLAALRAMGIFDGRIHRFSQDDAIGLETSALGDTGLTRLVAEWRPYVVLQAHLWRTGREDCDRLFGAMAEVVDRIVASGRRVLLVPMTFGDRPRSDRVALEGIRALCTSTDSVRHAPAGLRPEQLKYLFAQSEGAVVTRHHGMVFALGAGVRCVAVVLDSYYRQKLAGVAAAYGARCSLVPLSDVTATTLARGLELPGLSGRQGESRGA
jgi:polysaccharide pyruvyl transferase WcaK-like protein